MASTSLAAHEGAAPREGPEGRKGGDAADAAAPQPQEFAWRDDDVVPARVQGHATPHPLQLQYWIDARFRERFALEFKDYKLYWQNGPEVHMERDRTWCEFFAESCCGGHEDAWLAEPDDKGSTGDNWKVKFFRDGTALLEENSRHYANEVNRVNKQLFFFMKKWNAERNLGNSRAVQVVVAEEPNLGNSRALSVAVALEQHQTWQCPACTLVNNASAAACSACGTRRLAQ